MEVFNAVVDVPLDDETDAELDLVPLLEPSVVDIPDERDDSWAADDDTAACDGVARAEFLMLLMLVRDESE
jgi:hypothetical protein